MWSTEGVVELVEGMPNASFTGLKGERFWAGELYASRYRLDYVEYGRIYLAAT